MMRFNSGAGRMMGFLLMVNFLLITTVSTFARRQPNFLILVASDAGLDAGCYGNSRIRTPNIDQLAEYGVVCQNAFVTTPEYSSSLISLLSGKYPHTTRTEDLDTPLPDSVKLLPSYLRAAGYITGLEGDTGMGENGIKQFDWYSDKASNFSRFLDTIRRKPFFFIACFNEPRRNFVPGMIHPPHDPDNVIVRAHLVDDGRTRRDIALYYDDYAHLDSLIGNYLALLKSSNKDKNTLIIFLSRNGAPFPREKGTLYDRGIRIPMIFSGYPLSRENIHFDGLISTIDIAPTLFKLAELDKPADMPGLDYSLMLKGSIMLGKDFIYTERNWEDCDEHMRSVRNERYKLILNSYVDKPFGAPADVLNSPSWESLLELKNSGQLSYTQKLIFTAPRPEVELYDLQNDPEEYVNIGGDPEYKEIENDLINVLVRWMDTTGDFPSDKRIRADRADRVTGKWLAHDRPPLENDIK